MKLTGRSCLSQGCSASVESWESQWVISVSWVPASLPLIQSRVLMWDQLRFEMYGSCGDIYRAVLWKQLLPVGSKTDFLGVSAVSPSVRCRKGMRGKQSKYEKQDLDRNRRKEGEMIREATMGF